MVASVENPPVSISINDGAEAGVGEAIAAKAGAARLAGCSAPRCRRSPAAADRRRRTGCLASWRTRSGRESWMRSWMGRRSGRLTSSGPNRSTNACSAAKPVRTPPTSAGGYFATRAASASRKRSAASRRAAGAFGPASTRTPRYCKPGIRDRSSSMARTLGERAGSSCSISLRRFAYRCAVRPERRERQQQRRRPQPAAAGQREGDEATRPARPRGVGSPRPRGPGSMLGRRHGRVNIAISGVCPGRSGAAGDAGARPRRDARAPAAASWRHAKLHGFHVVVRPRSIRVRGARASWPARLRLSRGGGRFRHAGVRLRQAGPRPLLVPARERGGRGEVGRVQLRRRATARGAARQGRHDGDPAPCRGAGHGPDRRAPSFEVAERVTTANPVAYAAALPGRAGPRRPARAAALLRRRRRLAVVRRRPRVRAPARQPSPTSWGCPTCAWRSPTPSSSSTTCAGP